ncbi:amidohydrolase family protein [Gordonia sp. zg691]|uniref:N-acyl-D-amino-acid deacylase family protein n=1 Tax=Gordonia jinghuaiqii TaxID=2758710 RepID=UPI0016624974|nr:amidohydrolase family protein [Gordonia jinghuaiqii]MBD0861935.1 amidohydrolase family protein [Gordonia jinghuaiqii]
MNDLVRGTFTIAGALVIDDARVEQLDVDVTDGMIVGLRGHQHPESAGRTNGIDHVIDGRGRVLVPGFIDLHAHSAIRLFSDPELAPKIASGFTTELLCPDGLGPAPVRADGIEDRRTYLAGLEPGAAPWNWSGLASYLAAVDVARPSTNIVTCVPHSAVREVVMGPAARRPSRAELHEIQQLVAECLDAGARAVSFGLIYAPGLYAESDELVAVAEVAASYGVPVVPHIRNEASKILDSIGEFVSAAEKTGAPLHISHLKLIGNRELLDQLMNLCTDAADKISLTFDQYPYGAGSTLLSALLPPHVFAEGSRGVLARVSDDAERRRMAGEMRNGLDGWENILGSVGPENVLIVQAAGDRGVEIGKSVAQIADEQHCSPEDAVFDLLLDTNLDAAMIDHYATEEVVTSIFGHPLAMVGSDAVFAPRPHPRLYGTSARVLGRYAHRDHLISVQDAVRRMTSRPADLLGLTDRGRITEGLRADLVLLDLDEFVDTATYDDPCSLSPGVDTVFVGGVAAWRNGRHTGARTGQVLTAPIPH